MEKGRETDEEAGYLHHDPAGPSGELNRPQSIYQRHRSACEFPVRRREEITLNKNHCEVDVGTEQQLVGQVLVTVTPQDCLKKVDNVLVNHLAPLKSVILYVWLDRSHWLRAYLVPVLTLSISAPSSGACKSNELYYSQTIRQQASQPKIRTQ